MSGAPPFSNIRVLELSHGIAAQTTGMLLADLGAEVVRPVAAPPTISAQMPGFLCWNRGKTLVRAHATPDGAKEVQRLAAGADVLIADARPGELEARGLDATAMASACPGLVHLWMPPIAAGGRWSQLPHDHLLLDAVSLFAAHHPATEERPVASVVPTRFHLQGAMGAAAAAAALLARLRDGWGRAATVTGLQAEGAALCTLVSRSVDGPPVLATGKSLNSGSRFRLYQCGDSRWMFLGALSPELFYRALDALGKLEVMAREDVAGDFINLLKPEVDAAVGAELEPVFASRTCDEWINILREADVPAAPLMAPDQWLGGEVIADACPPVSHEHPQLGTVSMPGVVIDLAQTPGRAGEPPSLQARDSRELWNEAVRHPPCDGERPHPDALPLAGLNVLDTSTFLAGPFVGALLATHGAQVVKVENHTRDPYSVFTSAYTIVNEHKRVTCLDLRDPTERASFLELVSLADVVVDNLLPASLDRLQLAPEVFEAANADLVRCSITAFGQHGKWADFPGFDPLLQTMSGLAAVQGGDGRPITTGAPVHDVTTGSMGALGTLAALYVRETRGVPQRIFTSLAAASVLLQSGELTTYPNRPRRPVGGVDHPGPTSWQRYYEAQDRWIALAATTDAQRAALCEVIRQPQLMHADEAYRSSAMAAAVRQRPAEDWLAELAAAGVPACHVLNRFEMDDPFLRDQAYSHVVNTLEVGKLDLIGGFSDWAGSRRRPATEAQAFEIDRETARALMSKA